MNSVAGRFADHYLGGRLAPYVHSHHLVGTETELLEAPQPAGDMSDPACDDLAIPQARRLTSTPRRGPNSANLRRELCQMF